MPVPLFFCSLSLIYATHLEEYTEGSSTLRAALVVRKPRHSILRVRASSGKLWFYISAFSSIHETKDISVAALGLIGDNSNSFSMSSSSVNNNLVLNSRTHLAFHQELAGQSEEDISSGGELVSLLN